jgi:hypothetical protein
MMADVGMAITQLAHKVSLWGCPQGGKVKIEF